MTVYRITFDVISKYKDTSELIRLELSIPPDDDKHSNPIFFEPFKAKGRVRVNKVERISE